MSSIFKKYASVLAIISLFSGALSLLPVHPALAIQPLETFSTTLAQPSYSTDWDTDPSYSNVTYSWTQIEGYVVTGSDPCIALEKCFTFFFDLQDDAGATTTHTNQEWQTSIVPADVIFSGPANSSVSTTLVYDTNTNGRYEGLQIEIACSAACTFATSTAYSISIVNYPIKNLEIPGGYTPGTYSSLEHVFSISNGSLSPQQDATKTAVVAIGKGLTVSASVDPSLTFSVTGAVTSTPFYFDIATIGTVSNPDICNFGTLNPGVAQVCLFNLNISTNASDGYSIYVVQDNDMTSGDGNTIDKFIDGTRLDDTAAIPWVSPSSSYAHLGYSTNDTSVMDPFPFSGSAPWAGIPDIATSAQATGTVGLVADSAVPGVDVYVYALKVESASTLPAGTYSHNQYFLVVGNF